jgi:hypothetical protein
MTEMTMMCFRQTRMAYGKLLRNLIWLLRGRYMYMYILIILEFIWVLHKKGKLRHTSIPWAPRRGSGLECRLCPISSSLRRISKGSTVNQLLFAATLFHDSSVINWLATSNFRDRAFFIHTELHYTSGSRREIFATVRFSRTSRNFLARE